MRRFFAIFALAAVLVAPAAPAFAWSSDYVDPNRLLSDQDLTDTTSMSKTDLQNLFAHGYLGTYQTKDVNGVVRSATDIVWRAAQAFGINPKVIAVLLQREQSLVVGPTPSQDQLNWAMGYGICDDCSKNDPGLAQYKGFGNQVFYAAQKISQDYLPALQKGQATTSGLSVGTPTVIDGTSVTPATMATAILYTYTPHLHGNENFVRIWNQWFVPDYPSGSLLQDSGTGGVFLIRDDVRYPIASRAVLATSFIGRPIVPVDEDVLSAYQTGAALQYPDYSLLRTPDGGVYLIVDDMVRVFATPDLVAGIGYDPSEIINVPQSVIDGYIQGPPITSADANPQIHLLQDNTTGGIFAIEDSVKHPILSPEILHARFGSRKAAQVSPAELAAFPTGNPITFPDGTLVQAKGSPDIYVVSDQTRRLIADPTAFAAYDWKESQIILTDAKSLDLLPQGPDVTDPSQNIVAPVLQTDPIESAGMK